MLLRQKEHGPYTNVRILVTPSSAASAAAIGIPAFFQHRHGGITPASALQHVPLVEHEAPMTVENVISIGLLGWLAVGIVLMGLDIW